MRSPILKYLILIFLVFQMEYTIGQNLTLNINSMCNNSTACNPFYGGYVCQQSVIQATHGSPAFYLPTTNPTRQIELLAAVSSNGTQLGEGFTINYSFVANKTYTIKINHSGRPQSGALYPDLIVALTNSPPRYNDACNLGYLTTSNVYASVLFTISQAATTSSFTIKPTVNIPFLWLRSNPVQNEEAGLLIYSIEIQDHSIPPPPPPTNYACDYTQNFSFCGINWEGALDLRVAHPFTLACDAFKGDEATSRLRRFCAPTIYLKPGFIAYQAPGPRPRFLRILASDTPCTTSLNSRIINTLSVGIEKNIDTDLPDDISVYPSPSNGTIRISGTKSELLNALITIVDQSGRVVHQLSNKSENKFVEINLQMLPNGIYFVKINSSNKVSTKKIILTK